MTTYSQKDPAWGSLYLGVSPTGGDCSQIGCYVTAIADILTEAGYPTNPAEVIGKLQENGGFLPDGETVHDKVTEAYPMFRYDPSGTYSLVEGQWKLGNGTFTHFIAGFPDGTLADTFYGAVGAPAGFTETGRQPILVDPVTPPETPEFPKTVNLVRPAYVRSTPTLNEADIVDQSPFGSSEVWLTVPFSFIATGVVQGDKVDLNDWWLQTDHGHYVWSGNTDYTHN